MLPPPPLRMFFVARLRLEFGLYILWVCKNKNLNAELQIRGWSQFNCIEVSRFTHSSLHWECPFGRGRQRGLLCVSACTLPLTGWLDISRALLQVLVFILPRLGFTKHEEPNPYQLSKKDVVSYWFSWPDSELDLNQKRKVFSFLPWVIMCL